MTNYWNESSTGTKVIIVAAVAAIACGAALLCVLGLGLLGVVQLPGGATPTPEVAQVEVGQVTSIVVVVPTPAAGAPSAAVVCRVDVLSGPGGGYERLGVLEEGRMAEVAGVSQDGNWWVIKVAEVDTTQGWVSAKCLAVDGGEKVGVVPPPPSDGPPQAVISGPTEAQVGQPVVFSAGNSSVAEGSHPTTFDWDLGDGTMAQGVDVTHTYTNPGDYQVTLAVTDDKGRSSSATQAIKIVAGPAAPTAPPTQPVEGPAAVISAPGEGVVGQPVTFDGSGSTGPNPIVTYRWEFGDGSTADAVTVQKTYNAAGIYNLTLRVTDDQGLQAEATQQITILEAPPPVATDTPAPEATAPTPEETATPAPEVTDTPAPEGAPPSAALAASPPSPVPVGQAVTFDASGSQPGSSPIASYQWDFGDGNSATGGPQQTHQYSAPGTYTATVTVVDETGLSSSASQQIEVVAQ